MNSIAGWARFCAWSNSESEPANRTIEKVTNSIETWHGSEFLYDTAPMEPKNVPREMAWIILSAVRAGGLTLDSQEAAAHGNRQRVCPVIGA